MTGIRATKKHYFKRPVTHGLGIPQPKVLENLLNDQRVVNQGDNAHRAVAPWAR